MELLQPTISGGESSRTFVSHVFSTTEESKGEIMNVLQYSILALLPVFILNKLIQRFVPEADLEKSSLELTIEILMQLSIIFIGIVLVHRIVTYIPTYSGFKYENLALTNAILPFLVIILSIQSKLGLKANILYDRALELWNGPTPEEKKRNALKKGIAHGGSIIPPMHSPSQADHLDDPHSQSGIFPPAPVATTMQRSHTNNMHGGGMMVVPDHPMQMDPLPANFSGSIFGASF
jgi:ABC-type uncharacterized transport system permease subunit